MTKRSPIIGDLLEEYREVVRPARGRVGAALWFAGQLASLVRPWMWGAVFGAVLGLLNIADTALAPVSEDSPGVLVAMLTTALLLWGGIAFLAGRRHGSWAEGVRAGFTASAATMVISQAANLARVVLFAGTLQYDAEWTSLMARYAASGMTSLRTFVFYDYARTTPVFMFTFIAVGTMAGAIGSAIGAAGHRRESRARV